ncbi:arginyltransferase [Desulfobulbus rhabdoformis]|jgi:arginine-tRNA-protein transferase|uniref:arginyltransferase n=1 Tax=Desulfobulbus rhabdoformis TaxID=34032 RepID=UPI0019649519|nr:arginyltransferase [Desulfobulbus rhabdoformis]MBM9614340.1 arginyltransferase [Desulfobulbus rhabdoformis]
MIGKEQGQQGNRFPVLGGLERYFVNAVAECPYEQQDRAIYHQAVLAQVDDRSMGHLLALGYRRNGNCMYNMRCPNCSLCVPIRLRPERFRPNRNQRRVWNKNRDVSVEIAPLTMSKTNLSLLQRFLSTRFPKGQSSAESYYAGFFITSISRCFEIHYKLEERLIGVSIVDGSGDWLNAVYFFFDPDESWRSPGTLNILALNRICLQHEMKYLYLGYWIDGHQGMSYKSHFRPHEVLIDGRWQERS